MKSMKTRNWSVAEQEQTVYFSFCSTYIDAIGYDAQRAVLEVKLTKGNRLKRYVNVPEEIWYRFRESASPDLYYRSCICGHYREIAVCDRGGKTDKK